MLTKRQLQLLTYIDTYIKGHGYGPSQREMMTTLELNSLSGVNRLVHELAKRHYLVMRKNHARAIEVVRSPIGETMTIAERALTDLLFEIENGVIGGEAYGRAYQALGRVAPQ